MAKVVARLGACGAAGLGGGWGVWGAVGAMLLPGMALAQADQVCSAHSGVQPPTVVELYTSEGCSSCPPADRWASKLKGRADVLVLAFHVNYWDRLGWPDRFANAANTERQRRVAQAAGLSYVYTPQVVLNGRDTRDWSSSVLTRPAASDVALTLTREGKVVTANVSAARAQRVAGYWALLEDGHSSRVKAGENAGETLAHDHVVTRYEPLAAWDAGPKAQQWRIELPPLTTATAPAATPTKGRRVVFVVTDERGDKPLQAITLGC